MKGNKKKRKKQAKRVKEPDKPPNMVTKVDKALSTENADQNFFEKPQMHEASRMAPPDAADENFKKKIYEVVVDGTNMDDKNDLKEMQNMIENTFQLMFKRKWKKCIEEQKLEHPTWSFSYSSTEKSMFMYLKYMEERTKYMTYHEMCHNVHNIRIKQLMLAKVTEHFQRSEEWVNITELYIYGVSIPFDG